MDKKATYQDFIQRFKLLIEKRPDLITTTLSNIFTMRLIGNKTHGDLSEIGMAEFINQFMYDFRSKHIGKALYRSKQSEEDIQITNEMTNIEFSISLKAYGHGPLQLSTDKNHRMFSLLQAYSKDKIVEQKTIQEILSHPVFDNFSIINVLPLIYQEVKQQCNIMVFDYDSARNAITEIAMVQEGKGRKHPVHRFLDAQGVCVFEVRYGDAQANALQRGLWTNTKQAYPYFDSLTNGWIDYTMNPELVEFFRSLFCPLLRDIVWP